MEIKSTISTNIKNARKQAGLTQKEVASRMNIIREQYAKYERCEVELDYEKIIKVCKILDISPNEFFEDCL